VAKEQFARIRETQPKAEVFFVADQRERPSGSLLPSHQKKITIAGTFFDPVSPIQREVCASCFQGIVHFSPLEH
jgi:hypothetical protein